MELRFKHQWKLYYKIQVVFSDSATPVALLVPVVKNPYYSDSFKSLINTLTCINF